MSRWMPCREFVEFLDDYLAGRLPAAQVAEFNAHLSGCPACVAYMRSYQEAVRLGRAALDRSDEAVPQDVPEALVQAVLAARDRLP